jgi:hypothetical protein
MSDEQKDKPERRSFSDWLFLLWVLRERYYGWLWLLFLMALIVVFYLAVKNR